MKDKKINLKRPKLTCQTCNKRKVKCDRLRPCSSCVKIDKGDSCKYLNEILNDDLQINNNNNNNTNNNNNNQSITLLNNYNLPLINNSSIISTNFDQSPFNLKLLLYKKPLIEKIRLSDGSSIASYHPSFTEYAIFNSNPNYRKFAKLLENSIDISPDGQDLNLKITPILFQIQNLSIDINDILSLIDNVIISNFNGFKERLLFFNDKLSELFYFNSLPFETILKKFNSFFTINNNNGSIIFNPPDNKSQYAWISTFASLVKSTLIFSKSKNYFKFNFNDNDNDSIYLHELATKSLSYSNYKKYPNCGALFALLALRNNIFLAEYANGSISLKIDGYSLLIELINLIYSLGIHTQCDTFIDEGIPEDSIIIIWNWVQLLDAIFASFNCKRPIIDYDYCIPRLTESFKNFVIIFRFFSEIFNNFKTISLTDMICALDTVSDYTKKFTSFNNNDLNILKSNGLTAWSKLSKNLLITVFQKILFKIKQSCEQLKLNFNEFNLNNNELILIDKLIEKCDFQIICSIILSFKLMNNLVKENLNNSNEFFRPLLILRVIFSSFISNSYNYLISHLTSMNLTNKFKNIQSFDKSYKDNKIEILNSTSILTIESNLFKPLNEVDVKNNKILNNLFDIFNDFDSLLNLIMSLYNLGTKNHDLDGSSILNKQFKFLLSLCLLLKTINEHKFKWINLNPNKPWKISINEWKIMIDEAKFRSYIDNDDLNNINNNLNSQIECLLPWDYMENLFQDKEYMDIFESIGLDFDKNY